MTPDDGRALSDPARSDLHETDFFAWTKAQAALLRERVAAGEGGLDYDHLAEEVEGLGRSERRACECYIKLVLEHLLKRDWVDTPEQMPHHRAEVRVFRINLRGELTPSLRAELPSHLPRLYRDARGIVEARLEETGHKVDLPVACPYTWADVIGPQNAG